MSNETPAEVLAEIAERYSGDAHLMHYHARLSRSLAAGKVVGEMDRTAPPKVWLQVNTDGDAEDRSEAIPQTSWMDLTWHYESIGGQEVEYIRADLAYTAPPADPAKASGSAPDVPEPLAQCPISGLKFFANVEHPELGMVATYGGPFDSYTIPHLDEDDELRRERYDWDADHWVEGGEPFGYFYREQQPATPPASAPEVTEVTEEMIERARKGYFDAVGGIVSFKGMRAALTAARQEGNSHG